MDKNIDGLQAPEKTDSDLREKTLGEIIRDAREKIGMKSNELARLINVSTSYISKVEHDAQLPGREVVEAMVWKLHLNLTDVIKIYTKRQREHRYIQRVLRARRIVEKGGIPVPETEEHKLGQEILSNRGLKKGVNYLREIAWDEDLMCAALSVLQSLKVSAQLKRRDGQKPKK